MESYFYHSYNIQIIIFVHMEEINIDATYKEKVTVENNVIT